MRFNFGTDKTQVNQDADLQVLPLYISASMAFRTGFPSLYKLLTWRHDQLPLQMVLVVSFGVQIFGAVGLTSYLSMQNGQKAVNDLANQLMGEVSSRINLQLETYLSIPPQINHVNANQHSLGLLNLEAPESLERYFWYQAGEYDSVSFHIFGNEQGEYAGIERLDTGERQIVTSDLEQGYRVYGSDRQGNRTTLIRRREGRYDPRERPWYKAAVAAGKPTWGNIYVWFKNQQLGIPAVQPIYGTNGKLVGVFGTEIALSQLSDFLKELKLGKSGQTFIIDRTGLLVASSTLEQPFSKVTIDGKEDFKRLNISDSQSELSVVTSQYIQRYFGHFKMIKTAQEIRFQYQGEWHYLRITPFKDQYGLDWLTVVVMPESNFMAQINHNTQVTWMLCLVALAIAIISSIYTSRRITRPMLQLSSASEKLATQLSSEQTDTVTFIGSVRGSWFQEIGGLANSFNRMAKRLQESFMRLEQANQALEQVNVKLEQRVEVRTAELKTAKEIAEQKNAQLEVLTDELEQRVEDRTVELSDALAGLKQSQMKLVQSEKMSSLGQLVAGVAHEINNPVSFIYGNLSPAERYIHDLLGLIALYQEHYPEPVAVIRQEIKAIDLSFVMTDLPKLLASMKMGAERIDQIVQSLKLFSRSDEAEIKMVDLHEGIESTLVILQNRIKPKGERPEVNVIRNYAELPKVECYPGQVNQVFMNILSNALDAMEERDDSRSMADMEDDPSCLWITTALADGDRVVITIQDNGTGISAAVQQRLFDPFFTTKPVGKGTGLGMSISYQIISERHGGLLQCGDSEQGGAMFRIELPLQQAEKASEGNCSVHGDLKNSNLI
jgi:signal transduction histidine kinase